MTQLVFRESPPIVDLWKKEEDKTLDERRKRYKGSFFVNVADIPTWDDIGESIPNCMLIIILIIYLKISMRNVFLILM